MYRAVGEPPRSWKALVAQTLGGCCRPPVDAGVRTNVHACGMCVREHPCGEEDGRVEGHVRQALLEPPAHPHPAQSFVMGIFRMRPTCTLIVIGRFLPANLCPSLPSTLSQSSPPTPPPGPRRHPARARRSGRGSRPGRLQLPPVRASPLPGRRRPEQRGAVRAPGGKRIGGVGVGRTERVLCARVWKVRARGSLPRSYRHPRTLWH
jgi:hypothetical protein